MNGNVSRETLCLPSNIERQVEARRAGVRKKVRHGGLLCGKCLKRPPASGRDRWCHECRAENQRDRRKAERAELKALRELKERIGA